MNIKSERTDSTEIVYFSGILNAENVTIFREHIEKILNDNIKLVILNLEKLEEIDSSGIGAIISLLKRIRMKKGDLKILKLRGAVKKLFELLHIDQGIDVYEDLELAMK